MKKESNNRLITLSLLFFFAIGVLIVCIFSFKNQIIAKMNALKLLPQPEKFTELYFEDHLTLPTTITTKPQSFSFTIHNVEYQTMIYPYDVYAQIDDTKQEIDQKTVTIPANEYKTISESFTIATSAATKAEIVISLPKKQQQIDFFIQAKGGQE